jgi:hypothetical protein
MTDVVSAIDLPNCHANGLCNCEMKSLATSPSADPDLAASAVAGLMELAERLRAVLTPISPSPAFVNALGLELTRRTLPVVEVLPSRRRSWIIGATAVGSALSLLGLLQLMRGSRRALRKAS